MVMRKHDGQQQNLPGGRSAVVPPDPMPNSEVKRRSADGSVGSPHARVGNCQASNKTENLSLMAGVFCFLVSAAFYSQRVGQNRLERFCTAGGCPQGDGQDSPAYNCPASKKSERLRRKTGPFVLSVVCRGALS